MGHDVPDPPDLVQIQHQIRENATELQDYLKDLYKWEQDVSKRASGRSKNARNECPNVRTTANKKIVLSSTPDIKPDVECKSNASQLKSREMIERESGNANYKNGKYDAAIQNYTLCLAYNPRNPIILSNRAMAYLKNAQYNNAEIDCTSAIQLDPSHLKSYTRRGTARNALGKHRLALIDFEIARRLDPSSKEVEGQIAKTREALKGAIKRAPKTSIIPTRLASTKKEPVDGSDKEFIKLNRVEIKNPCIDDNLSKNAMEIKLTSDKTIDDIEEAVSQLVPRTPPKTSYEFYRVWRSLTPRFMKQTQVFELAKVRYLSMLHPARLESIFQGSIESDVLCEIFRLFRYHWNEFKPNSFIKEFVCELPKISRFRLSIMFLDTSDQENISSVVESVCAHQSNAKELRQLYNLP